MIINKIILKELLSDQSLTEMFSKIYNSCVELYGFINKIKIKELEGITVPKLYIMHRNSLASCIMVNITTIHHIALRKNNRTGLGILQIHKAEDKFENNIDIINDFLLI